MLTWTIQTAVISLVVIMILHNIYIYLKDNLTYPNVTDYVNRPNEKYNEIYNIISKTNSENINYETSTASNMKEELKLFLNQQLNNNDNSIQNSANQVQNETVSGVTTLNELDTQYSKF